MKKVKLTLENSDRVILIKDDSYTLSVFEIPSLSLEQLGKILCWSRGSYNTPFENLVWEIATRAFEEKVNKNGM